MCGRYALARSARELASIFDAAEGPRLRESFEPSYNLAPTRQVVGLAITGTGERVLDAYRWGFLPAWASEPSIGSRLFNARAETLSSSRAFGDALAHRRLAVLADGFFEWRVGPDGRRRPLFFSRADGAPLVFAGLWERWRGEGGPPLFSCTIVTTEAGPDLAGVHDRMPVVLDAATLDRWLAARSRVRDDPAALLRPAPAGTLVHHPVDPRVGDVRNDSPELLAPYEEQELRLFE
jgi:putative SOS response-associated peptidase YedK